ncbi:hypothetical protein HDU97_002216 [Phlyctochytrium planicorne]|nr:hypothetical protein HDU97_002216 [Phlyctochytrium planicorne]
MPKLSIQEQFVVYLQNFFTGSYSFDLDVSSWEWEQLWSPETFRWKVGVTPFTNISVIAITWVLYFAMIFGIKAFMANREGLKLTTITCAHNIFLSLWSFGMCAVAVYEVYKVGTTKGIDEVFCTTDQNTLKGPLYYIMYMYYISKFYELLDTVILVLRKKTLIFLHWYHHAIVIVMVWTWLEYGVTFSALGMIANTFVHVFMYYYYYATCIGQKVWFKQHLTSAQIFQFSLSFILSVPYLYFHFQKACPGWNAFVFSSLVNGSFLILFVDFYHKAYLQRKAKEEEKKKAGAVETKKDQ